LGSNITLSTPTPYEKKKKRERKEKNVKNAISLLFYQLLNDVKDNRKARRWRRVYRRAHQQECGSFYRVTAYRNSNIP
jgi:hypothetical protein